MEAITGGIELTGTLYTSAQGDAKDKLAMAQQIYDNELNKFQSEINAELQEGIDGTITEQQVNNIVDTAVNNKLGQANGIATLDANSKLTASQLPTLKTINGNSIAGSGDISIDLSIYSIVTTLPATGESNKIYLVLNSKGATGDLYSEYGWINNAWEKLGEYKAEIDLSGYTKLSDLIEIPTSIELDYGPNGYSLLIQKGDAVSEGDTSQEIEFPEAASDHPGIMSVSNFVKLDGIATGATADTAITEAELTALLV